jgi:hypothetical protein
MRDPTADRPPSDLVAALADLGRHLDLAAGPDPVAAAVARIRADAGAARRAAAATPARPTWVRPARALAVAAAIVLVAVVAAVAVPGSRAALARLLGVGAVRVTTSEVDPESLASTLDLGTPLPVGDALDLAGDAFPDPPVPGLGDPALAFRDGRAGVVTLVWPAGGDLPDVAGPGSDRPTGAGLIVTAIPNPDGGPLVEKTVGEDTTMTAVSVAGGRAYWITGGPHAVDTGDGPARRAGDTLVWDDRGHTYRMESALGLDASLALAEEIVAARAAAPSG